MNNVKKSFLLFLYLVFTSVFVNAQSMAFNTVKKNHEVKRIVLRSEITESKISQDETIGDIPNISKEEYEGYTGRVPAVPIDTAFTVLLSHPLQSDTLIVNSPYGYRKDPFTGKRRFHSGVDLKASGENVYAVMPGRIRDTGYSKGLGNYVVLDHGDLRMTYGHLLTTVGRKGDEVKAGQSVGITGSTGRSTGEHLHVSAKFKGKEIDPLPILMYVNDYVHKVRDLMLPVTGSRRSGTDVMEKENEKEAQPSLQPSGRTLFTKNGKTENKQ